MWDNLEESSRLLVVLYCSVLMAAAVLGGLVFCR